ncbi:DUF2058 domain-containing protein [Coralloluteibacterium thermophilus]|uniref:DUF2058 domain-containing protein n=1 Tax=Coralloluteibacterium thermophilum TaxID=2707049 RepID=A0ABV9NHL6_9GAMM
MRNPLQDQLLKAGLVKKSKVAQVVREQAKQRSGKALPAADAPERVDAQRLQAEHAERDRALAAERNAQARAAELRAQVRQIVETQRIAPAGDAPYSFEDGGAIRRIHVDLAQRAALAKGALAIVRHDDGYALLPRAAADKVAARDPAAIALDHAATPGKDAAEEDPWYARFPVPDDLVW